MSKDNLRLAIELVKLRLEQGKPLSDLLDNYSQLEQESIYNQL